MKPKKRIKRLEVRIEDYKQTVSRLEKQEPGSSKGYRKPGSLKK